MTARTRFIATAVLMSALSLLPLDAGAAAVPALRPVVYAVDLNGLPVSGGALMLAAAPNDVYVRIDDLRAWRLLVPAGIAHIMHDGGTYIPLRALSAVRTAFDSATQTLLLDVPVTALRTTDVELDAPARLAPVRPAGGYADYAFSTTGGGGVTNLAAEVATGVAAFGGVVRNDLAWTPGALYRLQTAWERDDPQHMRSLVLGDTATTDATTSAPLRFAGIRWATDFSEQPLFTTFPGFDIRGSATVPSALDIYVNDVLALRRDVPAGPYALHDLPLFDGAGTIAVRSADAAGGISSLSVPYYVARQLLRPGLAEFSYGAGLLDEDGSYGPFIVDAARRWGVTDRLTAGFSAQHGDGRTIAGANADWLAGTSGVIDLAVAAGAGSGAGGTVWDAGYDFSGRRMTAGAEFKVASTGFRSLDPTALAIGREFTLRAGLRVTRTILTQVSIVRDTTIAGPVSIWTFGIAGNTRGIPYSVTTYKSAGGGADAFGISGIWSVTVGHRSTLTSHLGTGGDSAQSQLEYAGAASAPTSALSWDIAAGVTRGADSAARINATNSIGEFDFDAYAATGFSTYTARVAGSVAAIGGKLLATRQITGAFGLVRVPGFAGIDVYVNSRYAGKTDARGDLVTADLVPFVENEIRIDPARLALTATVDTLTRTVVPTAFAGTTVVFRARRQTDVRLTIRTSDGRPLAPGTFVRAADGTQWPVGLDGHVDLVGLAAGSVTLRTGESAAACRFDLTVPADRPLVILPDAVCR